jgi:hypothetical protein
MRLFAERRFYDFFANTPLNTLKAFILNTTVNVLSNKYKKTQARDRERDDWFIKFIKYSNWVQ